MKLTVININTYVHKQIIIIQDGIDEAVRGMV